MKNNKAMYAIITGIIVVITALVILIVTYGPKEVKEIIDPNQDVAKDNNENKLTTKDSGIKVELPGSEWSTHGGDLYNRRYSPLEA
ncbi:MAG: hypothetical protein R3328_11930, partial [Planococcaceae bacterium]|nr:hypothetical protein [Planococcaceae bacterium]